MKYKKLTSLAKEYYSDKGLINPFNGNEYGHGYTTFYDQIFHQYIHEDINFLEMGLKVGGPEFGNLNPDRGKSPSVEMWLNYFSKANIIGFDISNFSPQENERFTFIQGDSGIDSDIQKLVDLKPSYDIILDDASHLSYHQQNAFKFLWSKISKGGYYIIEDLHWQPYQDFWKHLPETPTTYNLFESYFYRKTYIKNPLLSEEFLLEVKNSSNSCVLYQSNISEGKSLILQKRSF